MAREGLVLARRVGMTRMMGSLLACNPAMSLLKLGQWAEADELVAQTLALQPEAVFAANLLLLRAERGAMSGRYADSESDLTAARQALGGRSRRSSSSTSATSPSCWPSDAKTGRRPGRLSTNACRRP